MYLRLSENYIKSLLEEKIDSYVSYIRKHTSPGNTSLKEKKILWPKTSTCERLINAEHGEQLTVSIVTM